MSKFRSKFVTGNVIRTAYGSLQIVTSVGHDGYTDTIYVNSSNHSAGHRHDTYERDEWCHCGMLDCDICRTGEPEKVEVYGMDKAELVADTVQDWITSVLLDGFNF